MERLDKIIAGTGKYSRREVKELVRQGRVVVGDGGHARFALEDDSGAECGDGRAEGLALELHPDLDEVEGVGSGPGSNRSYTSLHESFRAHLP